MLVLLALAGLVAPTIAGAEAPVVRLVEFDGPVTAISAQRILRAIDAAAEQHDSLVLIELDTPGGGLEEANEIVKKILGSPAPVVVWIGPSGAHGASAGFFILIAADVAAMAPGTRTGAASTVALGQKNEEGDVLLKKINQDMAALMRSIAERRGRNIALSEDAVLEARSYEESVALREGLIDLIAGSREELLEALDGREVTRFDGTRVTLRTEGAVIARTELGFGHGFFETLSRPEVAYALLMLGLLGLYVEFSNPGLILPGAVGALCLVLFAVSTQFLPISTIGVLLIVLGITLFVLEVKFTSYGLLTAGGVASLIVGSLLLVKGPIPEMRVPLRTVLPTTGLITVFCVVAVRLAVRARRTQVATGVEGMSGARGTVAQALAPRGKVFVHGELWDAVSRNGSLPEGTPVRVASVRDMVLTVVADESETKGE